ncbi:MAG: glycosyltransferase family 4 protein [Deltaproteobacteria bacterium]|nr:glycosyltransferase family 4 protein [Deltaproteobacteria bacterium]
MTANPEERRFRIAMVVACAFPANHGTPAAIREICETLVQMGHEIHIITYPLFEDHIPLDPRVRLHRPLPARCDIIPVGPSLRRVGYDLLLPWTLLQVVRRYRCQVIHVHNYEGLMVGILGKMFTGKPLIYNAINTMGDELPSYGVIRPQFLAVGLARLLDRFPPRAADHVIANTLELKDFLVKQGVAPERITPVPTAIDASFFAQGDRGRVRRRYHLGDRPVVIYTGTFDFFQGLELLLQAFGEVKGRIPDAALLLLGSTVMPEHRRSLEAQARELGIIEDVIFAEAPFGELPDYLAAADVGVVARPISKGMPVKILNGLLTLLSK